MQIITIDGDQARAVFDSLSSLNTEDVYTLRVAIDDGQVKFKVNEGVWSPPYGTEQVSR